MSFVFQAFKTWLWPPGDAPELAQEDVTMTSALAFYPSLRDVSESASARVGTRTVPKNERRPPARLNISPADLTDLTSTPTRPTKSIVLPPTPVSNKKPTQRARTNVRIADTTRPPGQPAATPTHKTRPAAAYATPPPSHRKGAKAPTKRAVQPAVDDDDPFQDSVQASASTSTTPMVSSTATSTTQESTIAQLPVPSSWLLAVALPVEKLFTLPADITLYGHQLISRSVMAKMEDEFKGGILSDDMGYGKTMQMLIRVFDHWMVFGRKAGPTLVIVPLAVITTWDREIQRLIRGNPKFKDFKVYIYHGPKRKKDLSPFDLVITTHTIVRNEYRALCTAVKTKTKAQYIKEKTATDGVLVVAWRRVIIDEAHVIRSSDTLLHAACLALISIFRWCLTGTPLHNNVSDLYSLFAFLKVHSLAPRIMSPVPDHPSRDERLVKFVSRVMLRRTKHDKHQWVPLEPATTLLVECIFSEDEREFYGRVLAYSRFSPWVRFLRLIQACLHPELVRKALSDDSEENISDGDQEVKMEKSDKAAKEILQGLYGSTKTQASDDETLSKVPTLSESTKLSKLLALLLEIEARGMEEKTVVFSQFTSFLDIVQSYLDKHHFKMVRYDGTMSMNQRDDALVAIATTDATVMLVSLKAGGTGLNLTCCNNVILLDLWWNPAIEEQAVNRVHRIGQSKKVHIYKIVITDTIEQRILKRQEEKSKLARDILGPVDEVNQEHLLQLWGTAGL